MEHNIPWHLRVVIHTGRVPPIVDCVLVLILQVVKDRQHVPQTSPMLHLVEQGPTLLILVVQLKASGYGVGLISRGMALGIGEAQYSPQVAAHLPSQANALADSFSAMRIMLTMVYLLLCVMLPELT